VGLQREHTGKKARSMADFSERHQDFIDESATITEQAKEALTEYLATNFDLDSILEDPTTGNELIASTLFEFEKYYLDAVSLGLSFGEFKAKLYQDGKG
jgi:hypothetical protein